MPAYSAERHKWEMEIQTRYALDIYKRVWSGCEIVEVDKEAFKSDFAKDRDFSGLDKIIKIGRNEIHLSQRFRKPRKDKYGYYLNVDFSFRYKTPGIDGKPREAEYFCFMDAYKHKEEGYWLPSKYAFGITKGKNTDCGGFTEFYIFDLLPLLEAIDDGRVVEIGVYPNYDLTGTPDGSSAIYYRIEDIKRFTFWELPKGQVKLTSFF